MVAKALVAKALVAKALVAKATIDRDVGIPSAPLKICIQ
jgi:hypothetical protein